MSTLNLHLSNARPPTAADTPAAAGSHGLAPLALVVIVVAIIGVAAVSAVFRSATAAISMITQPTVFVFRMLVGALIVIVLLVAVLVSRPADAHRPAGPTPTSAHPAR
jgi:hypothetical protein